MEHQNFLVVPKVFGFSSQILKFSYPKIATMTRSSDVLWSYLVEGGRDPMYTWTDFQYMIPPFLMCSLTKSIFSALYKWFNFDIIEK